MFKHLGSSARNALPTNGGQIDLKTCGKLNERIKSSKNYIIKEKIVWYIII